VLQLESNFEQKRIKIYPNTFLKGNLQLLECAASNNINKNNTFEIVGALMRSEYISDAMLIQLPNSSIFLKGISVSSREGSCIFFYYIFPISDSLLL